MSTAVGLRNYALVTIAYWGFTLSDGALRMLVLLHFYELGYSALEIAVLFLLYEFFGVITNLVGGWIAARLGLSVTLYAGLTLQIAALAMLAMLNPAWPLLQSIVYVMAAQALSGIAKDLTKMSAKSAVKLLAPEGGQGTLFRWVAVLTGSKNALKGAGFFMGGVLLALLGFRETLLAMAGVLALVLLVVVVTLPRQMGKAKAGAKLGGVLAKSAEINLLSAARLFLFGARDIWFVVGLPLFLSENMGWGHAEVGAYMAVWVYGYGLAQASAPKLVRGAGEAPDGATVRLALLVLLAVTAAVAAAVVLDVEPALAVIGGLLVFGVVFAVNSAVHSYLILAYAQSDRVALDVGFYYMANAAGRLVGTFCSGLAWQLGGIAGCLLGAVGFLLLAMLFSLGLPKARRGAVEAVSGS